ncbi:MAG: hypothetical protein IH948_09130 [Bacteroidetes bacterium]|nr:hypothetical protein [Bacteroidota bacterium]
MRPTLYADDLADLRDKYGGPLAKAVEPFERILPRPCPVRCSAIDTDGTVGPDTGCAHDRCHERAGEQNCRGRGFVPQPVPDTWMSTWTTPADDPDPSDSLVYSLESCMTYQGSFIDDRWNGVFVDSLSGYNPPFTPDSPWGGPLTIDPQTGIIDFIAPNIDGEFCISVRVEEYRAGVLIGSNKLETRVLISTNCVNKGSNDAPVWIDDAAVPNAPDVLPAQEIPCEQSKVTITLDKAIQYGSWALDTSDVILKDELGIEVTSATITPIGVINNLFTQMEVQLDSPQFQNIIYDLTILNGSDGNTLLSECGDAMAPNSTIQLVIFTCVTIPVTITNVTVETGGCGEDHLIQWKVDDPADLTDGTLLAAFNNWEVLACTNSLTSSCTQIGTTTTDMIDIEEFNYPSGLATSEAINFRIRAEIGGPTTQLFSNMVNSIYLEIKDNTPDLDYAELSWSPYNGWVDPTYQIQLSTDTTNWITVEESKNPFFSIEKPGEIGTVYIRIVTTDGTFTAYSNCESYDGSGRELIVPDIFTPNGDGVNDLFAIGNLKY